MAVPADERRPALIAGIACYGLWGLLPLYLHMLERMGDGAFEIVAHRTLWSVPFALALTVLAKQGPELRRVLATPRTLAWLALSTLFILANWTIYVWSVTHDRVLESSLGYFLNPLLAMAAGAVLFRERMSRIGLIAIGLATLGVAVQTVALGKPPFIALGVATSFCGYAIVRKRVAASAQTGLLVETLYLLLPALALILWLQTHGQGHALTTPLALPALILTGPITVVPLALFSWAARRLPLTTVAFLQFLAPTLQFLAGLLFGERLTAAGVISFALIWAGVATFAYGAWRAAKPVQSAA